MHRKGGCGEEEDLETYAARNDECANESEHEGSMSVERDMLDGQ